MTSPQAPDPDALAALEELERIIVDARRLPDFGGAWVEDGQAVIGIAKPIDTLRKLRLPWPEDRYRFVPVTRTIAELESLVKRILALEATFDAQLTAIGVDELTNTVSISVWDMAASGAQKLRAALEGQPVAFSEARIELAES